MSCLKLVGRWSGLVYPHIAEVALVFAGPLVKFTTGLADIHLVASFTFHHVYTDSRTSADRRFFVVTK